MANESETAGQDTARPFSFEHNGEKYEITAVPPEELVAALIQHLRTRPVRLDPAIYDQMAGKGELQDKLVAALIRDSRRALGPREAVEYIDSIEGVLWCIGYALRRKHPNITDQDVLAIFVNKKIDELQKIRESVSPDLSKLGS